MRETYDFGKVTRQLMHLSALEQPGQSLLPCISSVTKTLWQVLGHGASGEVLLAIHKVTQQQFACKVVRKDTKMNDAQVGWHITK